ncbi:hypothetical protein HRI_004797200 [Hibiscus trionum]|uniref:Uncharacterized protein n=1 Tax=Hibiscus trionum TaxID=183268 RepID=A0A9W7JCI2_HIBTR|nr:hypothetical protein HRI_004797200 [Hibiscus trionum]
MSGIMHKIGETLHMGGDHKEEDKHKGEGRHDVGQGQAYAYGGAEHKGEGYYDASHGQSYGTTMTGGKAMTGTDYKGETGGYGTGMTGGTDYKGETGGYGTGMTGGTYMGEAGHGHTQGEQHKEGLMDKIKDKIHGDKTTEHGQEGEKKKKERKKREDGHESSSSDSD